MFLFCLVDRFRCYVCSSGSRGRPMLFIGCHRRQTGSPPSGQNLGGWVGSSGSQPHLSPLYWGTPGRLGLAAFDTEFSFIQRSAGAGPSMLSTGLGLPHSGQNFPVAVAPQEHFHPPPAGSGCCDICCCGGVCCCGGICCYGACCCGGICCCDACC